MMKPELRSYPCAICNGTDRILALRKRGLAVDTDFQIVRCRGCGHHYVDPRISDEDLGSIYGDDYYRGKGFDRGVDFYGKPDEALQGRIGRIVEMVGTVAGRPFAELSWLDYGCGTGDVMSAVVKRGARVYGYDLGKPAQEIAAAKGHDLLEESELTSRAGTFDVVSAIEVIEHVPDPRAFLRHLVSLLKIGGILYVQTGNWNFLRHVPGRPYIMPEGHLHYFTPPEMRRLFATSGLSEADVLNVSWIGAKAVGYFPIDVSQPVRFAERLVRLVVGGYAQYPVGIRVT